MVAWPESRRGDVLAYIRFLKLGLNADKHEIIERFEQPWERLRERTSRLYQRTKTLKQKFAPYGRANHARIY